MTKISLRAACKVADSRARQHFTYAPEPIGQDEWRSYADKVRAKEPFKGDCDDLASTVLDLVTGWIADGSVEGETSDLFRLCVKSPACPPWQAYDHMVAAYIHAGDLFCFGDTNGSIQRPRERGYSIAQYSRVSEGIVWRKGAPLKGLPE